VISDTACRVSRKYIAILATESLQQQSFDLRLAHENNENNEPLQGICQVSEKPDIAQLILEQPGHYFHRPIYAHHDK